MISLKYIIYGLGLVFGVLSLFYNQKTIKIISAIGLVFICIFGLLDTYLSETRLSMQSYTVEKNENVYKAKIVLQSSKNEQLGILIIVAKIQEDSTAKILDLRPVGFIHTPENPLKISDDAKMATLTYQPGAAGLINIEIELDNHAIVDLQGNYGLKEINIKI